MLRKLFCISLVMGLCAANVFAAQALWQGKGRIAVSCDGNDHDKDDWAATPMTLALIAAKGLQDKTAVYIYSDHVWGNFDGNVKINGLTYYEHMKKSALEGADMFGFDKSRFVCAVDNPELAFEKLKEAIDASSESDPLIIIGAGPMGVIGEALNRADKDKLKYVTLVSHSRWNNNHAASHKSWNIEKILKSFGEKIKYVQILDQNGKKGEYEGLKAATSRFNWLKEESLTSNPAYKKGAIEWLYGRLLDAAINGGKRFDVSDSGMLVFILTGAQKNSPDSLKEILENPLASK